MPFLQYRCRWALWQRLFLSNFVTEISFSENWNNMTSSIPRKAKVNAKRYVETLLPRLIQELQVSSIVWFHFPTVHCTCSDGKVGSRLDCHKLQWTYWQRWMTTNLPDVDLLDYHVWGSYAWTLQDISSQAKEHWWTEESLAVNIKPAAAGLNQQAWTRPYWASQQELELAWKARGTFRTRFEINCLTMLDIVRYEWVTVHIFGVILKYRVK